MKKDTFWEEAELRKINKSIARGRVQNAMLFAFALTAGIGTSKFLGGDFAVWLLHQAYISFGVGFLFGYFFMDMTTIKKRRKITEVLGENRLASPPASETRSWIALCLIFFLLASPTIFYIQIASFLVNLNETTTVDVMLTDGTNVFTKLAIPQSYIMEISKLNFSFGQIEFNELSLMARLHDMKPLPKFIKDNSRGSGYSHNSSRYRQTPDKNPNTVIIQMKNKQTIPDKKAFFEEFYSVLTKDFPHTITYRKEEDMGLEITSAKMKIPNLDGKSHVVGDAEIGVPTEPAFQNMLVVCDKKLCCVIAEIPSISLALIFFHPSKLRKWKDIYKSSEKLLQSFIKK